MKILSVKFLNLNSLRGEREIRFDKRPFTESGLFAITGPTGAGKTTILDAITAALYGRVHRHDDVKEIMSRHTGESYAEVEFEVNGKSYRAKWSVHRSRGRADGNFRSESMELAELATGKIIGGHTATATKNAIVELCGLDYSQFLRSVILSQGDFTKFLKASDSDRSELLEKITDTGIYSDISKFIFSKQRDEKEKLDLLIARLEDTVLLSDEEVQGHKSRLDELIATENIKKQEREHIAKYLNWLNSIEKLNSQLEEQSAELKEKETVFNENIDDFQALERHELAVGFKPQLVEIKGVAEQAEAIQSEINKLNSSLPDYRSASAEALAVLQFATDVLEKAQLKLRNEAPILEKVSHMDTTLESLDQQIGRLKLQMEAAQQTVENLKTEEENKTIAVEKLQERLSALDQWLADHDSDKTLEKQLINLQQLYRNFAELSNQIDDLRKEKEQNTQAKQAESQKAEQNQILIGKLQTTTEEKKGQAANLSTQIKTTLGTKTLDELELELNRLPLILQTCDQQYRIALNYKKATVTYEILVAELALSKEQITAKTKVVADLEKRKETADQHLADLRELVLVQERLQKYDADRGVLTDGEPCPLCGAVHHPYADDKIQGHLSDAEQKRNLQELVLNEIQQTLQRESLQLNTLSVNLSNKENELNVTEKNIAALANEFGIGNSKLSQALHIAYPATIADFIQTTKNAQHTLQQKADAVKSIVKQVQDVQNEQISLKENLQNAQGQSALISERVNTFAAQEKRAERLIGEAVQKRSTIHINLATILQPLGITFLPEQFAQTEQSLHNRAAAYARAGNDLQQTKLDQAAITTGLAGLKQSLKTRVSEADIRVKEYAAEVEKTNALRAQRMEMFGINDPAAERQRLEQTIIQAVHKKDDTNQLSTNQQQLVVRTETRIFEESKKHTELESRLQQLQQSFLIALNKKGVSDIETLQTLFLIDSQANQLTIFKKDLEARIAVLKELIKKTRSTLDAEVNKQLTTEPAVQLADKLAAIELEFSVLNQEIGKLKQVMAEDALTRSKFTEIARQIEIQKSEFARWNNINALIGSADGKKFSRFAQGLTLIRLVDLANLHLQKFSDRYLILKSPENDLELLIVDGYQADVVRPTASLSGGESFLVSLSLALGLSDLASHKVQINSLFIDEGFGTLDAETLDTAISALENLQAKGKTIGIISHVEALKERIGTQIQLSKLPGGVSKIKVVEYGNVLYEV